MGLCSLGRRNEATAAEYIRAAHRGMVRPSPGRLILPGPRRDCGLHPPAFAVGQRRADRVVVPREHHGHPNRTPCGVDRGRTAGAVGGLDRRLDPSWGVELPGPGIYTAD